MQSCSQEQEAAAALQEHGGLNTAKLRHRWWLNREKTKITPNSLFSPTLRKQRGPGAIQKVAEGIALIRE